ncbi:MAG: hypothetical protein H6711_34100 [Myxococcales bacterium]|nr:hypothetical protein [Myxococcales bacterium]
MRALALALGLPLVACGPDFPPVIWSGDHLEYATDVDRDLCEGTFHVQDRFVEQLSALVGVSLPEPVLFVYVEQSRVGEFCQRPDVAGCAREDAVISTKALNRHELAHAVTLAAGWGGPSPFVEGVAEMFNDGIDLDEVRAPIAEVLDDFQITDVHYFTMGLFVRFLVERHDLDSLAAFMRDTDHEAARAEYEATFAKHFGESLDDAMLAFEGYPTCPEWSNRIAVVECGLPLTEWVDGALEISVDVECGSADVTGPLFRRRDRFCATAPLFVEERQSRWSVEEPPRGPRREFGRRVEAHSSKRGIHSGRWPDTHCRMSWIRRCVAMHHSRSEVGAAGSSTAMSITMAIRRSLELSTSPSALSHR